MGDLSPNFSRSEFACKDYCGLADIDLAFVDHLQALRDHVGRAVHVNSGCRCAAHNESEAVGGKPGSQHTKGLAADIWVDGWRQKDLARVAWAMGFRGVKVYKGRIHVDDRQAPRWREGFS